METQDLLRLLHVISVGLFIGSLFAMMTVQSLLQRALTGAEQTTLARAVSLGARTVVNPFAIAAFLSGLLYWYVRYSEYGTGRLMACSPAYVHIMLGAGFFAVGLTQVWKARVRGIAAALERGAPPEELHAQLARAWVVSLLALAFVTTAYCVGTLRVPAVRSRACFADLPRD